MAAVPRTASHSTESAVTILLSVLYEICHFPFPPIEHLYIKASLSHCMYLSLPPCFVCSNSYCLCVGRHFCSLHYTTDKKGTTGFSPCLTVFHCQERLNFQNITAVCPMGLHLTQSHSLVHTHKPFFFFCRHRL